MVGRAIRRGTQKWIQSEHDDHQNVAREADNIFRSCSVSDDTPQYKSKQIDEYVIDQEIFIGIRQKYRDLS